MRFSHYFVRSKLGTRKLKFQNHHYRSVGLMPMISGLPIIEAFETVNKMNRTANGKCTYWLETL